MKSLAAVRPALLACGLAGLLLAAAPATAAPPPACAPGTTVETAAGAVCGGTATVPLADDAPIRVYKGIPYALPPVPGQGGRWAAPKDPAPFAETPYRATRFGSICAQAHFGRPNVGHRDLSTLDDGASLVGSEDCLHLNVYAPAGAGPASGLPVMVFLFGGSFVSGAASAPLYDAGYLAAAGGVVAVTLDYRLGAYGFLYARGEGLALDGNFGLLDQQKALQWVRRNIAAFGGDPGRVTLFGESAGAMSVGLHLFSMPSSNGLFRRAIMQSNPASIPYPGAADAARRGEAFLADLCATYRARTRSTRCPPAPALIEAATTEDVFRAQMTFTDANLNLVRRLRTGGSAAALTFGPTLDGTLVAGQPSAGFAEGVEARPFLFGVNRDEGVVFAYLSNGETPVTGEAYGAALEGMFGAAGARRVEAYASDGVRFYSPAGAGQPSYYTPAAAALASVLNDYWFRCGNLEMARRAVATLAAGGGDEPVYAYQFVQPPSFDLYGPACAADTGNVCHGNELPFVFNSLGSVTRTVRPEDRALATAMSDAWTAFARTGSPGADWPAFDGTLGSPAKALAEPPKEMEPLDVQGHCSAFWYASDGPVESRP